MSTWFYLSYPNTLLSASASRPAAPQGRYYAETGYTVSGAFLTFLDRFGGVRVFGYPIGPQITENGRPVQYFERQRFEYHAEAAGTDFEVQLGRLGAETASPGTMAGVSRPFASTATQVYFPETRHSLSYSFLDFWKANGGLRILGYPITEPIRENGLLVQYFERARMEYHPEYAAAGYGVELTLLGRQYVSAHPNVAAVLASASRGVAPVSRGGQPAPVAPPALTSAPLSAKESTLFNLINGARRAGGVAPVALDGSLRGIALSRSQDMVARNYFSHTTPDGTDFLSMLRNAGVSYQYAGEIITNNNYSEADAATQAYNSFMGSQHHHDILMDPRYNIAGVGEMTNGQGFHYFTVIFVQK